DPEDRAESVVDAVDGVADPSGAATMPPLATKDRIERRPRSGDGTTRERAQDDGVIAFFKLGVLRDPAIRRIVEALHELVVFRLRAVLLLLEAMQDDV